jgi:hypothetical protein
LFGGSNTSTNREIWKFRIETNEWAWIAGDTMKNSIGVFGTKGIPGPSTKPGTRSGAAGWFDTNGNLYIFGGVGPTSYGSGYLNDLWKYNFNTEQWTWLNGDSTSNGGAVSGTQGVGSPNNKLRPRSPAAYWSDTAGNLWLFGGAGYNGTQYPAQFNDVQKYNPLTNEWTWMKGDPLYSGQLGVFGTKGVSSPNNTPGSKSGCSSWKDASGDIWIFGGYYRSGTNNQGNQWDDLWKYNMSSNQWVWLSGDNTFNSLGNYNTQGVSSPSNRPGNRSYSYRWLDTAGHFWFFGGTIKVGSVGGFYLTNDLWRYVPDTAKVFPVHLISFIGKLKENKIELQWLAENEQSFDRYEILRSLNSNSYNKIGEVTAANRRSYRYLDNAENFSGKKLYYRLKLVDKDGKFSYSNIVAIRVPSNTNFSFYPNPAKSYVQLVFPKTITGNIDVEVIDVSGKVVMKRGFKTNSSTISLSTEQLAQGTYNLRLSFNGEQAVKKLTIIK